MKPLDLVLNRLRERECSPKKAGTGWGALCLAHDDKRASLSVSVGEDGRVLIHCHAGCSTEDVLARLGLQLADLFPEAAHGEWTPHGPATCIYDYTDEEGTLLSQVCRTADKQFPCRRPDPNSKSGWTWNLNGVRRVLFRLPRVLRAIELGETIYIVEGEKDALALEAAGVTATCNPGGAGKWRRDFTEMLRGAKKVVVVADKDEPGRAHARSVVGSTTPVVDDIDVVEAAEGKDASDHLAAGYGLEEFVPIELGEANSADSVYADAGSAENEWPDPIPYQRRSVPEFPCASLYVPALREYVMAEAEAVQVPADVPGLLALANLSAAIAPKVVVDVRPDYVEPVNLYVVIVLETGERKSPPFDHFAAPLREWEREEADRGAPELRRARRVIHVLEQGIDTAQKKAAAAIDADEREEWLHRVHDLDEQLAEAKAKVPWDPRIFCDNVTAEKLAGLLTDHGGAMAAFSDEGSFISNCFRYSAQHDDAKIEHVLKAYGGEEIRVDRGSRAGEFIRRPCLTLAASVQPEYLRALPHKGILRGRGVFSRCLFGVPASLVGWRDPDPAPVPEHVRASYGAVIQALAAKSCPRDDRGECIPYRMKLCATAHELRRQFAAELELAMRPDGDLVLVRDWANKAVGRAIRIAALLHLAEQAQEPAPWGLPISKKAVEAGIALVRYGLEHFMAAMGLVSGRPSDRFALVALGWIEAREGPEFLVTELYQSKRRSFEDSVENMEDGLTELERRHYVRPLERPRQGSRGRLPNPRSRWAINPKLRTRNTEKGVATTKTGQESDSVDSLYSPGWVDRAAVIAQTGSDWGSSAAQGEEGESTPPGDGRSEARSAMVVCSGDEPPWLNPSLLPWLGQAGQLADLWDQLWSRWQERAAIFEYDHGLPRKKAERLAWEAVSACRPSW